LFSLDRDDLAALAAVLDCTERAMDEISTQALAGVLPELGKSFAQASSNATRRLCEQSESFARTVGEWNAEVSHFLAHRATRNSETMTRTAKCQSIPDVLAVQAQWVQDTADDYLKEMSKLMEVNSRIMCGLLRQN
jgi:hypothetical protein